MQHPIVDTPPTSAPTPTLTRFDLGELRRYRRALDLRIRALKAVLRTRWTEPMVTRQRLLIRLQREATELCVLRAWLRGRLHLRDVDLCREIALRRRAEPLRELT